MGRSIVIYSGAKVSVEAGVPDIESVAVSLGRLPRFAGHTFEWYNVLSHTVTVAELLEPQYQIYGLMHDWSESVYSDVPSPVRMALHEAREKRLFARIVEAHGLPAITDKIQERVNWADKTALAAEAHIIGHPKAAEYWPEYNLYAALLTEEKLKNCRELIEPKAAISYLRGHYKSMMSNAPIATAV